MDELTRVFLSIALTPVLFVVFIRCDRIRHVVKLLYFVAWFAFSAVLPVFAVFVFHLPKGDYTAAVLTMALMMFLTFVWWKIGWPELRRSAKVKWSTLSWWNS